jgi:hypothetical protein
MSARESVQLMTKRRDAAGGAEVARDEARERSGEERQH